MSGFPLPLRERLQEADARGERRRLGPARGADFSSNDYLGFAGDPVLRADFLRAVKDAPVGATGSRLLRGNHGLYREVEGALAEFCGRESALLFASGYQANVGILSALLTQNDFVFSDALNHASIIDGIRLSRARKSIYPHLDLVELETKLRSVAGASSLKLIVTESVFSMEGTLAPLAEMAELASRHDAYLLVDESHATGLWGGGLVRELGLSGKILATVHTGGKALGTAGAWVAGDAELVDYLTNFSRSFIFSTAPAPAMAVALGCALGHWRRVGEIRAARAKALAATFQRLLGPDCRFHGTIVPVVLGGNSRALEAADALQYAGFDVRAIRSPTVPAGQARLRLSFNSELREDQIGSLADHLRRLLPEVNP